MARTFPDPLPLSIPLRTTWEESWQLQDEAGDPVPLAGYHFRMQVRDKRTGELLITLSDEGATPYVTIDAVTAVIAIKVPASVVQAVSPTNRKRAATWDCELYQPAGAEPEYVVPLLKGSANFTPRVTRATP